MIEVYEQKAELVDYFESKLFRSLMGIRLGEIFVICSTGAREEMLERRF